MEIINQKLAEFIRFYKLRKGDSIFIENESQEGMVIYDGQQLLDTSYSPNYENNILPEKIVINDYPHINYFKRSYLDVDNLNIDKTLLEDYQRIDYMNHFEYNYIPIVYFNTDNTYLELVKIHQYDNTYYEFRIYTQKLKYRLFTVDSNLEKIWKGIVPMDTDGEFFYENSSTHNDYIKLLDYLEKSGNPSILYYIDSNLALKINRLLYN